MHIQARQFLADLDDGSRLFYVFINDTNRNLVGEKDTEKYIQIDIYFIMKKEFFLIYDILKIR